MDKTVRTLRIIFFGGIAIAAVIVIAFECCLLPEGGLSDNKEAEFLFSCFMILASLAAIPVALKLFKFSFVDKELHGDRVEAPSKLCKWGTFRMLMLLAPLIADVLLYYVFMRASFGYLAILLLLSLPFVWPSRQRCEAEVGN